MDELVLELAARAGPLVILAALFLLWDHCRSKFAAARWARRDEEFNALVAQMAEALHNNAEALKEFGERMAARPCLWEQSAQRLVHSFEKTAERVAETVAERANAARR